MADLHVGFVAGADIYLVWDGTDGGRATSVRIENSSTEYRTTLAATFRGRNVTVSVEPGETRTFNIINPARPSIVFETDLDGGDNFLIDPADYTSFVVTGERA